MLTRDVEVGKDQYQPLQWSLQEVTLAVAHDVPCLIVAEDGVEFNDGLAGDLAQIRFAPGDFASTLKPVLNQVVEGLTPEDFAAEFPISR